MKTVPRWSRTTKQLVSATLMVLSGLLIYRFRSLMPPLIIAVLVAYLFAPLVGWLSRKLHIGRGLATALIYLVGLGLMATAPAIAVPAIVDEVRDLQVNLDAIINRAITWVDQLDHIVIFDRTIPLPEIEIPTFSFDKVIGLVQRAISPLAGGAVSVVITVASGVGWIIFIAVISFYLLVDAERIGPALITLVPPLYREEVSKLIDQIDRTWSAFLRGQIILCIIIGVITAVAMSAIGVKFGLALGVVAGLLELIPNLGPFLAAIPAVLLALFQGSSYLPLSNLWVAILVAGIYVLIQSVENNLLVPRIIGSSLNLHPLVVIVGVLAGATLGGILGALLAAPVIATLRDVIRYLYCKLADLDPFPEPPPFSAKVKDREARAILFDLDGTLLDTDDVLVEQIARRMCPFPFMCRLYDSKKLARRLVMTGEKPISLLSGVLGAIGLEDKAYALAEWLRVVSGRREPERYVTVQGVIQFIKEASQEYDLGITTTRSRQDTEAFLKKFELEGYFKAVVTRQDVKKLKPHPESIRKAAAEIGCAPEQCIVVGDTTMDLRAGKKAGALTVGVLCGFGERTDLERIAPDLIVDSTAQLGEHLNEKDEKWYQDW